MISSDPCPTLFIVQSAIELIHREVISSHDPLTPELDQETGGIVIGKRLPGNTIVVVAATGPGPKAEHHPYEFVLDADYANAELRRWIQRDGEVDFLGVWHKHPPTLEEPSGGDAQTAYGLFADANYANVHELVNPIVLVEQATPYIRCFYMTRQDAVCRRKFRPIKYEILPDTEVPLRVPSTSTIYIPTHDANKRHWYQRLNTRFRMECERLAKSYEVCNILNSPEVGTIFTIGLGGTKHSLVYLVTSDTYPNLAPIVYVEHNGREMQPELNSLRNWSAELWLDNVVKEVFDYLHERESGQEEGR